MQLKKHSPGSSMGIEPAHVEKILGTLGARFQHSVIPTPWGVR